MQISPAISKFLFLNDNRKMSIFIAKKWLDWQRFNKSITKIISCFLPAKRNAFYMRLFG